MSTRLDKAKAALHDAKHTHNHDQQGRLLEIARTQAAIAGAEALEDILLFLEKNCRKAGRLSPG